MWSLHHTLHVRSNVLITAAFANGRFGTHLTSAGDVFEYGYDDMILGSYSAGAAVLFVAPYPPAEDVLDELTRDHVFWIVDRQYGSVLHEISSVSGAVTSTASGARRRG